MNQKLYYRVSGNTVSITYNGKTYTISEPDEDRFSEIVNLLKTADSDPSEENIKAVLTVFDPMYVVQTYGNVKQHRNGQYYLEGVSVPIPQALADKYVDYAQKGLGLEALENFWKLLVLNPDKHVRESLFKFADRYNFPITEDGHFVAYKSVAWGAEKYRQFAGMVSSLMNRNVTSGYGKSHLDSPQYVVYTDKNIELAEVYTEERMEGTIKEIVTEDSVDFAQDDSLSLIENFKNALKADLFSEMPDVWEEADQTSLDMLSINEGLKNGTLRMTADGMKVKKAKEDIPEIHVLTLDEAYEKVQELMKIDGLEFTDHHSRNMEIRIGTPVSMPREDCDNNPDRTCSAGLHVGAPEYVKDFGHSERFVLACLVNPMNVVSIPSDYQHSKMRCCEYYPFALAKMKNGEIEELDQEVAVDGYKKVDTASIETRLKEINELGSNSHIDPEEARAILNTRRTQL